MNFQLFETDSYIVIEMEYLTGGQLKRVFEGRLQRLKGGRYSKINNNETEDGYDGSSSDDELFADLKLTKPLFSECEISAIMKSVLTGLAPVHDLDYIHRDIKPENIVLGPNSDDQE